MNFTTELYTEFFVARTPLLPLNEISIDKLESGDLDYTLTPELLEAIYLASPVLYNAIQKIQCPTNKVSQAKRDKVLLSLVKYINRASNRCTPFGLFSGCSFGRVADDNDFNVTKNHIKHLRLDMDVLCRLVNRLKSVPSIRKNLNYRINPVIYTTSRKDLKYIEYKYDKKGRRTFHLSRIPKSWLINEMLKISEEQTLAEIAQRILDKCQVDLKEIYDYLDDLITNNVLLSSIEPNVTGPEFFLVVKAELERICLSAPGIAGIVDIVKKIHTKIEQIKVTEGNIKLYREVKALLAELLADEELEENKIFQVDLIKSSNNLSLSSEFAKSVLSSISEMNSISNRANADSYYLKRFRKAFKELYPNQVVKLTDLLDYEVGLGYKKLNHSLRNEQENNVESNLEKLAFKKYLEFIKNQDKEILITEEDLKPFQDVNTSLPKAFSIMGSIVQNGNGNLFSLTSMPLSTTGLLGRFCHAEPRILNHIKEFTDIENEHNKQDTIIAEIAHLPQSRIGNILSRPTMTAWEIEFLSSSKLGKDHRIPIDDLYVTLDRNELILFSKRLKKRIIPRLSSAHNYSSNSLEIYHFLCDLQHQGRHFIKVWDWGEKLRGEVYLPRVTYKNVIVSRARWVFDCKEITRLIKENNSSFEEELQIFKDRYHLPEIFIQKQSDNFLVIDSNDPVFVSYLKTQSQSRNYLEFSEHIFDRESSPFLDDKCNTYANEIIIPVITNIQQQKSLTPTLHFPKIKHKAERTFFLGDKWLYLKIYTKGKTFNSVLLKILPVIRKLKREGWLESYFFIRYADPMPHIRLRLLSGSNKGIVLDKVFEKLSDFINSRVIVNITSEKYERELERYSAFPIELSEKVFELNSELVLSCLNLEKGLTDTRLFAIFVVERSLRELHLSFEQRHQVYKAGFSMYANEFGYFRSKNLQRILGKEFKMCRQDIIQSFDDGKFEASLPLKRYIKSLRHMTRACPPFDLLDGRLDFLLSHIHMFSNRWFSAQQRYEEFAMFYMLDKYYRYKIAMDRKK